MVGGASLRYGLRQGSVLGLPMFFISNNSETVDANDNENLHIFKRFNIR